MIIRNNPALSPPAAGDRKKVYGKPISDKYNQDIEQFLIIANLKYFGETKWKI